MSDVAKTSVMDIGQSNCFKNRLFGESWLGENFRYVLNKRSSMWSVPCGFPFHVLHHSVPSTLLGGSVTAEYAQSFKQHYNEKL